MAPINTTRDGHDDNYSPQSPEPSDPSPISTPPKNVSTINSCETTHTKTGDITFCSQDEPRRKYWTSPLNETYHSEGESVTNLSVVQSITAVASPQSEKEVADGNVISKKRGVSQHVCEACRQMIPSSKDIPGPSAKN